MDESQMHYFTIRYVFQQAAKSVSRQTMEITQWVKTYRSR